MFSINLGTLLVIGPHSVLRSGSVGHHAVTLFRYMGTQLQKLATKIYEIYYNVRLGSGDHTKIHSNAIPAVLDDDENFLDTGDEPPDLQLKHDGLLLDEWEVPPDSEE
jgi:hypothetical protein